MTTSDTTDEVTTPENSTPPQPTSSLKPEDFVPTLAEKPESKPIYDNVRQVKPLNTSPVALKVVIVAVLVIAHKARR